MSFEARRRADAAHRLEGALPAAAVLFLFIIPTTLVFHAFWSVDPEAVQDQMIQFLKNLAMMGGMLYIVVHGPDPLSLDRK